MNRIQTLFLILFALMGACKPTVPSGEWITAFDGESLQGWKKSAENPGSFSVEDGTIKCSGPRAHLFYERSFENFVFEADVKTSEYSNSGIFIHTRYQPEGWPAAGYEIQVNNSYRGNERNPERRKTGSIYNIRNIYYPIVSDHTWFRMRIRVVENFIEVFVNDVKVNEYIEPEDPWRPKGGEAIRLGRGTFALQAHDPGSTTWYKNIRIKSLPDAEPKALETDLAWDTLVTKLMRAGFPLIDYHVHLKGGLTIDDVLINSRKLGINYGIAPNCGLYFPVTNDASLNEYIESVQNVPAFKGMQAEGREWITLFSPSSVAKFDYVFTDAMTFTDALGRRNRIWIPEEVWVDDKEQFMDMQVAKIEAIFSQEPVDIYVNPTVLPEVIRDEYDVLWTRERMKRVIDVLVQNDIALEINARYKVPSVEMIRMAKEEGVKFSFGTNNTSNDLGRLEYCIEMIEACELTPNDMFEPKPDSQKPINVKNFPEKITG